MQPTTSPYNDPALVQARNDANTAFSNYGTAQQNTLTMPDLLKKALDQKFASKDNPLYQDQSNALNDYLNAGNTGYQSVLPENNHGMIFAPSSQAEQIAGRRNSALSLLSSINQMIGGGFGGITNIIDSASKTYQAQELGAKNKADTARQRYQDLLDEIDKKVQQANVDRTFAENVREFGLNYALEQAKVAKGSVQDQSRAQYQNMVNDIRGKKTLRDLLAKYGADFTPDEIYGVYNAQSPWGPAKESGDILQKLGINNGETADQKNRKASLAPAKIAIQSISPDAIKMAGPQNKIAKAQIDLIGGAGVDQRIVGANQQFELMKQSVVRALQGARMSDKDIEIAKGYIPSITDTPATINTKLVNLSKFIDALGGDYSSSTPTTTNTKSSDPLKLF